MGVIPISSLLLLIFAISAYAFNFSICNRVRLNMSGPAKCGKLNDTNLVFSSGGSMFMQSCADKQVWQTVPMYQCFKSKCQRLCQPDDNSLCARRGTTYRRFNSLCDYMYHSCRNFREVWVQDDPAKCTTRG